jgi:hypothetical protein
MDSDGYWRCHRADHGGEGEHHVNDRAWTGRQAVGTVRLRSGAPCDPDCTYPIRPRLGTGPGRAMMAGDRWPCAVLGVPVRLFRPLQ